MFRQKLIKTSIFCLSISLGLLGADVTRSAPVHTTYLWHMQQPIYWPDRSTWDPVTYEKAYETIILGHSQSDVEGIFNKDDRVADYQWYPHDAIGSILSIPDAGAQVSFSGCLIENIESLAQAGWNGGRYAPDWYADYREARSWGTSGGRPRLDLVLVTYHHCLGPLVDENALRKEIELYKQLYPQTWGASPGPSLGFFPTETSFSERMIKVLVEEGIDWTFVANVHLSRACADYPWVANEDNIDPPNPADQINPAQGYYWSEAISRGITTHNPPPFAYQPHWAKWVDPETGEEYRMIVVPTAQAMGWNDSYASHGTDEIDAIAPYNDPEHPMLIVLSHDGDNAYSGGYSYYNESVPNFVQAAVAKGYEPTTVEEYLADHPPDTNDVVHVEDGSWVYADNDFGHPQLINWNWPLVNANGDFDIPGGWALDERNWAVITAAENRVETAEAIAGGVDISKVQDPTSGGASDAELAWHFFLPALTSGYMYYGSALDMEVKPTLACNEAVYHADLVIGDGSADQTPPTIWLPQRLPYNPGGIGAGPLWGYQTQPMPREFWVWTFVYDVSGVSSVVLKYRLDLDGVNPLSSNENETYEGGPEVGPWRTTQMTKRVFPKGNFFNDPDIDFSELPTYIADEYWAQVTDTDIVSPGGRLVDYWVEATDSLGWVKRSPIQHVWVGTGGATQDTIVYWLPDSPSPGDSVTIYYDPVAGALPDLADPVYIHIGHSGWQEIVSPDPTMVFEESIGYWSYTYQIPIYATSVDFCFRDGQGNWDNNQGNDWHIQLGGGTYQMDGQLDEVAELLAVNNADTLWVDRNESQLYLATNLRSGSTNDRFIFLALSPGGMVDAPWLKSGKVASFDAYLAREGENGWTGWFENQGAAQSAGGRVLEGWIDLQGEFGFLPDTVYLALGIYQTPDYGCLMGQVPSSLDGDGDIDGDEYVPSTGRVVSIYINELLASNEGVNQDEAGDYDSWIELYNSGISDVNLGGMYLTDDLSNPTKWQIPDTTISAGGFLLFWADEEEGEGPLHTNFKLSAGGEQIGLFDADVNGNAPIDTLTFGAQSADISYGRYPDGGDSWLFFPNPTPGDSNTMLTNKPPVITGTSHTPSLPDSTDTVTITSKVTDESGLDSVILKYDTGLGYQEVSMWDDGGHGDGEAGDSVYGGFIPPQADQTTVNYYIWAEDDSSAVTTDPEGAPTTTYSYTVGYLPPTIFINELMADNQSIIQDEAGEYEDWIELYNPDSSEVNLGGMWLTDDLEEPTRWQIPDTVIAPGGFFLFWADSEVTEGPFHLNFKLSNQGGWIGLFDPSGSSFVDSVGFGPQSPDTSWGRYPDGGSEWEFFPNPTPGGSNIEIGVRPGTGSNRMPTEFAFGQNWPNPFNSATLIRYQLSADRGRPTAVTLRVYNVLGELVRTLVDGEQAPGYYSVRWDGKDSLGKDVSSGIYFCRLKVKGDRLKVVRTRKMILLR